MSATLETSDPTAAYESALIKGDLAGLSQAERLAYYKRVCETLELNPLTRPFDYITLNGKLTLYARKDATEQLRKRHGVSITIVAREAVEGCYVVTARAALPTGRQDESIGAVDLGTLKGEARANAMMKAETKAKRRVTLSICGLGVLDETEVESIPGAVYPLESVEANRLPEAEQRAAREANPQPRTAYATPAQLESIERLGTELHPGGAYWSGLLHKYGVNRLTRLTEAQAAEVLLDLGRRLVEKLLGELCANLDDVRERAASVTADVPGELSADEVDAALRVLRQWKGEEVTA